MKKKGEWIRGTYQVLQAFPFVQGALYYVEISPAKGTEGEGSRPTRFIHALNLYSVSRGAPPDALLKRDRSAFFPLQGLFVEEGILYQVLGKLEGTLMAHHLYREVPLSLREAVGILKGASGHLVRMYEQGEFTIIHPQNMILTEDSVRFLYGGPTDMLPKRGGGAGQVPVPAGDRSREEPLDAYSLGALAYIMLTGASPSPGGNMRPISSYRRDVPRELEHFVMQSLTGDPRSRPRVADLWRWLSQMPVDREFQKKKADTGADLKSNRETVGAYLFTLPEVADGDAPAETPLDPGEWEGWQAGNMDGFPITEERTVSRPERKPGGERVWSKPKEPEKGPDVTEANRPEPGNPLGTDRAFWKRRSVLAVAATLFLIGAGTGLYLLIGSSLAGDAEEAAGYYGESVRSVKENRIDEAISQAKQAVEADPTDEEYLLHLANLYGKKKQYNRAVQTLKAGVKEVPKGEVYDSLAVYLLLAGEPDQARDAVEKALKMEPKNPLFHYHRGKIYGARENYDAAAQAMGKAVQLDPDNAAYHNSLAAYFLRTGEIDGAKRHAKKATKLEPDNPDHWLKAGQAYLADRERVYKAGEGSSKKTRSRMAKRTEAAIRAFSQAASLDPRNSSAYYYLSISQYFYGSYQSAEKSADKAVHLDSKNASRHYQHGVALQRLNRKKEAKKAYGMAVELEPNNTRYQKALEQIR
ncbi:tetratricopeptide repeat protein [Salinithrix halophila]|uniref:Tetratricopeptide repeat protein n=2 Tax=Salinithrix halophila TaxID=1485204 RepID=A0ABV8J9A3_9BACL